MRPAVRVEIAEDVHDEEHVIDSETEGKKRNNLQRDTNIDRENSKS